MLNAAKSFLFGGRDQLTVAQQCCRRVGMESVEAKDKQYATLLLWFLAGLQPQAMIMLSFFVIHSYQRRINWSRNPFARMTVPPQYSLLNLELIHSK
jgi:hypothetical protein